MLSYIFHSLHETQKFAEKLANEMYLGTNILFYGDLGAGKTSFIKAFIKSKQSENVVVSSPSYSYVNCYNSDTNICVHMDLYRLDNENQIPEFHEYIMDDNVTTLVEWSERVIDLDFPYVAIKIKHMSENSRKLEVEFHNMTLSKNELDVLFDTYKTPKHIISHIRCVSHVAEIISKQLIKQGEIIDLKIISQATLLHDIVRYIDFKGGLIRSDFKYQVKNDDWDTWIKVRKKHEGMHHAVVIHDILMKMGYPFIAKAILAHRSKTIFQGFHSIMEKVMYYADRRCKHDQIVILKERLEDLKERYGEGNSDNDYWNNLTKKSIELEKELGIKDLIIPKIK